MNERVIRLAVVIEVIWVVSIVLVLATAVACESGNAFLIFAGCAACGAWGYFAEDVWHWLRARMVV